MDSNGNLKPVHSTRRELQCKIGEPLNTYMATADHGDWPEQSDSQSRKIIQNRLALLGEESVSVGHRRHPPPDQ